MPSGSKLAKPDMHAGDKRRWRVGILSAGGDVGSGDGSKGPPLRGVILNKVGDVGSAAQPASQFVPADELAGQITKYCKTTMPPCSTFWFERRSQRFRCRYRKNPAMSEAWVQDGGMYEAAVKLLQRVWMEFYRLNLDEDAPFEDIISG